MERNHKEEIKNAIGMVDVRLKNIENTLATVEMTEDIREALCDEKEELEVYLKALKRKTPEEYIARIQQLQESTTNEYDEVIEAFEDLYRAYPERRTGCWVCGEQGQQLNGNLMCSRCAHKKTPEEYIDLIGKLQDELHESSDEYVENRDKPESRRLLEKCDELERQIKQTYDEFFTTYPERKVMCWYCGEQGHLLNPQGMCSWCASK